MERKTDQVAHIMQVFAARTGLSSPAREPRRYLWTDAFAVCNFLELYRKTHDRAWLELALKLVDQVHGVLGRHRPESPQQGWLSGLDEREGARHPTLGGLRIGKKLDERQPDEPFDSAQEWDRDGQYFHYLTKWAHALHCLSLVTRQTVHHQWARELMTTAYAAFSYTAPDHSKRIVWKMSIDLSRPLVNSMGQHDPLDGLLTCLELEAMASHFSVPLASNPLQSTIGELEAMCAGKGWITDDALGIGGLLTDAYRVAQLIDRRHRKETSLLDALLRDCALSLDLFSDSDPRDQPAIYRLAFRELGLAIGLQALSPLAEIINRNEATSDNPTGLPDRLQQLLTFLPLHEALEQFWLQEAHQTVPTWQDHQDINSVMLGTSLAPASYLQIG